MVRIFLGFVFVVVFASAVHAQPDVAALLVQAQQSCAELKYADAINAYQNVLRIEPDNDTALAGIVDARLKYAGQCIRENKHELAVMHLRKVEGGLVARTQEDSAEIARLYAEIAVCYADRHDAKRAVFFYQKAMTADPGNVRTKDACVTSCEQAAERGLARRDYAGAQAFLKEAIAIDPQRAHVYELQSDVFYFQHNLAKAEESLKKARDLYGPTSAEAGKLTLKLDGLQKERTIQGYKKRTTTSNFDITIEKGAQTKEVERIKRTLRKAYQDISAQFKWYPREKIPVIIYNAEEFADIAGPIYLFISGEYDGKVRIPDRYAKSHPEFHTSVIYHELAHAFIHEISADRCPRWLNEGLAVYIDRLVYKGTNGRLKQALRQGTPLSAADMTAWQFPMADVAATSLYYEQAYSVVKYLIVKYRMAKVMALLKGLGDNAAFDDTFNKQFLVDFDAVYAAWLKQAKRR